MVQIVYKVVKFYVLEMNLNKITQIVHNSNFYVYSFFFLALSMFMILGNQALWAQNANFSIGQFQTPQGTHPHDVAVDPADNGPVWFTAQGIGDLGKLDPKTGNKTFIQLGNASGPHMNGSAPHGVILGPDKRLWITDEFQKAIVQVDPKTHEIKKFPIPIHIRYNLLNTATFDKSGVMWFTDRIGYYGKLDPSEGKIHYWAAPRGPGPYGITTTPDGSVYFNSWFGNYTAKIDLKTGNLTILEPPTKDSMPRRIWSDSKGQLWITEWAAGKLAKYDPATNKWQEWKLPGVQPQPYAVYVDEHDKVWVSDFGETNGKQSMLRFDPVNQKFDVIPLPSDHSDVRMLHGRAGQVWGAESGIDRIMVIRTGNETS
jgi:virginiamycin B lyase